MNNRLVAMVAYSFSFEIRIVGKGDPDNNPGNCVSDETLSFRLEPGNQYDRLGHAVAVLNSAGEHMGHVRRNFQEFVHSVLTLGSTSPVQVQVRSI